MKRISNCYFAIAFGVVTLVSGFFFAPTAWAGATCFAPWGGAVPDGSSVVAYEEERATGGRQCRWEYRYCTNGFLSGFYRYQNCVVDWDCYDIYLGRIYNGGSIVAYRNSVESGGRQCESEVRYCRQSFLSGSFTNRSCTQF